MNINKHRAPIILFIGTIIYLLPLFSNSDLFFNRGNDLQEFFWPLFVYVKRSFLDFHSIPLWNPLWFGGMPLAADPQAPIWYPLNIIFLILPISTAFTIGISLHSVLAVLFMYKCSKSFGFSKKTAIVLAILYLFIPRNAASLEAGHWGIVIAWAWIPAFLWRLIILQKRQTLKNIALAAICLVFLYLSHSITAIIVLSFALIFFIVASNNKKIFILQMLLIGALTVGMLAPALLPQLIWQSHTTRALLQQKPDTYPKWVSKREFLTSLLFVPRNYDTEKVITLGIIPSIIAIIGLFNLKKRHAMLVVLLFLLISIISLNNASPFANIITTKTVFALFRVNTRFWIIALLATLFLIGKAIDHIDKSYLYYGISTLLIVNVALLSFQIFSLPFPKDFRLSPEIYSYLPDDKYLYRTYCPTRCLSQRDLAVRNIQSTDGYATLIPNNFFVKSWGLFGGYWDYYTLSLPPYGAAEYQKLQPDIEALGEYNTAFIISKTKIEDRNLSIVRRVKPYTIYKNNLARGFVYSVDDSHKQWKPLSFDQKPNSIHINTEAAPYQSIVVSQTYSPGWKATDQNGGEIQVQENSSSLTQMTISKNTRSLTMSYYPPGFSVGMLLFLITILFLCFVL